MTFILVIMHANRKGQDNTVYKVYAYVYVHCMYVE